MTTKKENQSCMTLYVGGLCFGIPVLAIKEVLQNPVISEIQLAKPEFEGLLSLRGQLVHVLNLRLKLGINGESQRQDSACIILKNKEDRSESSQSLETVGLFVEKIGDVIEIDYEQVTSAAHSTDRVSGQFTHGVSRQGEELITLLNLEEVLKV